MGVSAAVRSTRRRLATLAGLVACFAGVLQLKGVVDGSVEADVVYVESMPVRIAKAPRELLSAKRRCGIAEYLDPRLGAIVQEAAAEFGLPCELLVAVGTVESGLDPAALSPAGAAGVMQLMPRTAAMLGVRDPWSARQNVFGGAKYLALLSAEFGGDLRLALAAYNAGPEAVKNRSALSRYPETRSYVERVVSVYNELTRAVRGSRNSGRERS